MANKKYKLLIISFLIIFTASGCYNKGSKKSLEISPTKAITLKTEFPLTTPSEIALQNSPIKIYPPTNTPLHTPSNTKVKPVTTKNVKSSPKKTSIVAVKSLRKESNTKAPNITSTPLKTPSTTNKTPLITCDGDVCRIIIE